jgi:hypothetical protein
LRVFLAFVAFFLAFYGFFIHKNAIFLFTNFLTKKTAIFNPKTAILTQKSTILTPKTPQKSPVFLLKTPLFHIKTQSRKRGFSRRLFKICDFGGPFFGRIRKRMGDGGRFKRVLGGFRVRLGGGLIGKVVFLSRKWCF